MGGLRPEEEWARQLIEKALGSIVVQHDDGTSDGQFDLRICLGDTDAAVEVVAAADGASIELWNLLNGGDRWIEPGLVGGWMVSLVPTARATRLRLELPSLLAHLESEQIRSLRFRRPHPLVDLAERARRLGVTSLHQSGTDFPGSIYIIIELPIERTGGFVVPTGDALAAWCGEFLARDCCDDVRRKLARSGMRERHAFVLVPGFADADFGVTDLLMREGAPLPGISPTLQEEITHVWAISTWSTGSGMRWSPAEGWCRFSKSE